MSLLTNILRYKPAEWNYCNYEEEAYVRIALDKYSPEYKNVKSEFLQQYDSVAILYIERVQHPFAYGRYCIRREQLTLQNGCKPKEKRKFLPIEDPNTIPDILAYNCDSRRGEFSDGLCYNGNGYVLVIKTFGSNFDFRDTHRYPEYLIKYRRIGRRNYDDFCDKFNRMHIF